MDGWRYASSVGECKPLRGEMGTLRISPEPLLQTRYKVAFRLVSIETHPALTLIPAGYPGLLVIIHLIGGAGDRASLMIPGGYGPTHLCVGHSLGGWPSSRDQCGDRPPPTPRGEALGPIQGVRVPPLTHPPLNRAFEKKSKIDDSHSIDPLFFLEAFVSLLLIRHAASHVRHRRVSLRQAQSRSGRVQEASEGGHAKSPARRYWHRTLHRPHRNGLGAQSCCDSSLGNDGQAEPNRAGEAVMETTAGFDADRL